MSDPTDFTSAAFDQLAAFIAAVGEGFPTDGDRICHIAYAQTSVTILRNEIAKEHDTAESVRGLLADVLNASRHVCWFDWSGNDADAVDAVEWLRRASRCSAELAGICPTCGSADKAATCTSGTGGPLWPDGKRKVERNTDCSRYNPCPDVFHERTEA